jgi:hypothetical protein
MFTVIIRVIINNNSSLSLKGKDKSGNPGVDAA